MCEEGTPRQRKNLRNPPPLSSSTFIGCVCMNSARPEAWCPQVYCRSCAGADNQSYVVRFCSACSMRDCPLGNPLHHLAAVCLECDVQEANPAAWAQAEQLYATVNVPPAYAEEFALSLPWAVFARFPSLLILLDMEPTAEFAFSNKLVAIARPTFSVSVEPNTAQVARYNVRPDIVVQYEDHATSEHRIVAYLCAADTCVRLRDGFVSSQSFFVAPGAREVKLTSLTINTMANISSGNRGLSHNFKICFVEVCTEYGQTIACTRPFHIVATFAVLTNLEKATRRLCT